MKKIIALITLLPLLAAAQNFNPYVHNPWTTNNPSALPQPSSVVTNTDPNYLRGAMAVTNYGSYTLSIIRGTNLIAQPSFNSAYPNMLPGDGLLVSGTATYGNNVILTNVIISGTPNSLLVPNPAFEFETYGSVSFLNCTIFDTNTFGSSSYDFPYQNVLGGVNVMFSGCNLTGPRPLYHHDNNGTFVVNNSIVTGAAPFTTELGLSGYSLIENTTINATNFNNQVTNLANPFVRGIYFSRSCGTSDVVNVIINYTDIGSTNPAYGIATDYGSTPYTARNVFYNSCRLENVIFNGTCTNPLSADILVTCNNAYLIGSGVHRSDGLPPTVYNPSNYANPFNYKSPLGVPYYTIQTNFLTGTSYSNYFGVPIQVSANAALTTASVAGMVQLSLEVPNQVTNRASLLTAIGVVTGSSTNALTSAIVPVNGTYYFRDTSSGAGDSATATGGQIFVY